MKKLFSLKDAVRVRRALRRQGKKVVFTNGTFDILHRGHVEYLTAARSFGDALFVGLNTDASIRRIKGEKRPINGNRDRAAVLAALQCVDVLCFFGANTPARMIRALEPDVLVKGADWKHESIVGRDTVEKHGGVVRRVKLTPGRSTTAVIERILAVYSSPPQQGSQPHTTTSPAGASRGRSG